MAYQILLVDDNHEYRTELIQALENEYDFIQAENGDEALNIIKKPNNIDLVLLDIKMPGPGGIDILKRIRRQDGQLGVIILTGYSSKDTAVEALRSHADDYIEKSFSIEQIKATIEKILAIKNKVDDLNILDTQDKINKVIQFIEKNSYKKVSLNDAAKMVGLSPKYISRIFKIQTGKSFNYFRLNSKIKKAKELLKSSGYNIDQLAEKFGYENTESFIRIFKKFTKETPMQYKLKHKKK